MVRVLVELEDNINRILNLVKVRHGFKDKSETINFVVSKYLDDEGEPELRPEFVEKMKKVQKEKSVRVDDFAKRYGLID